MYVDPDGSLVRMLVFLAVFGIVVFVQHVSEWLTARRQETKDSAVDATYNGDAESPLHEGGFRQDL